MKVTQTLSETFEHVPAALLRRVIEVFVGIEAGSQTDWLAQGVDLIDLAAGRRFFDAADDQAKTIGAEIDGRKQGRWHTHGRAHAKDPSPLALPDDIQQRRVLDREMTNTLQSEYDMKVTIVNVTRM
ncbi:hypothetical protein GCM10027419_19670 [Pandoraea terrae]